MTKPYRELVAVQATFSKDTGQYRLTHYYKWKSDKWTSGCLAMVGYDMALAQPIDDVAESLRNAYGPATMSIWTQDEADSTAQLLQFTVGARPDELGLPGEWSLYAEL